LAPVMLGPLKRSENAPQVDLTRDPQACGSTALTFLFYCP
jgi:hypothetical protein